MNSSSALLRVYDSRPSWDSGSRTRFDSLILSLAHLTNPASQHFGPKRRFLILIFEFKTERYRLPWPITYRLKLAIPLDKLGVFLTY
jgi:hypothetical protein